jgi:hypothetical protein
MEGAEGATFFDREVILLVVQHQIQNGAFGQRRRFIE